MKMPPAANSHDFDLLNAWKSYATDGVDAKTGNIITPARLPHIGLLARLHLGIDATSCQAERNFSALSALLGDLQSNLGRRKVEMMRLLKLNQQLIPGLADVLQQVADLKDATNCCWQRCVSVIVYWLSLTVRVLLAIYWHFRGGRYYYY